MATTSSLPDCGAGLPSVRTPRLLEILVLLGVEATCLAGLTAAGPQPGHPSGPASSAPRTGGPTAEPLQMARRLYRQRCASCHDTDGTGGALRPTVPQIPDFTSHGWHARHRDAQLVRSILEGKGTRMPAFHGKIGEDVAQDLVTLLRTFDPGYDPTGARRQPLGAEEFERRFRQLDAEMEELKKQYREASAPPRKP